MYQTRQTAIVGVTIVPTRVTSYVDFDGFIDYEARANLYISRLKYISKRILSYHAA